jgi:nucleoside triphosphate pyrophosphatase
LYHARVLILASQSPRRRELLHLAGFDFIVRARPVTEIRAEGEAPEDYVRRLAREKVEASRESADEIVLGADTTVVVDDHVLEKPLDTNDARRMLRLLSGREHTVMTGIALLHGAKEIVDVESTRVHFVAMSDREIEEYVASGEPMDKAGAYAIQGLASKFVDRIEGCYFNVMGLPLSLVYRRLNEIGIA